MFVAGHSCRARSKKLHLIVAKLVAVLGRVVDCAFYEAYGPHVFFIAWTMLLQWPDAVVLLWFYGLDYVSAYACSMIHLCLLL
jgi:hypothetical protein